MVMGFAALAAADSLCRNGCVHTLAHATALAGHAIRSIAQFVCLETSIALANGTKTSDKRNGNCFLPTIFRLFTNSALIVAITHSNTSLPIRRNAAEGESTPCGSGTTNVERRKNGIRFIGEHSVYMTIETAFLSALDKRSE